MPDQLDLLKTALQDRYAIEGQVGAGGMAMVYAARDLRHHRRVAVKVLRPELGASIGPERFLREIAIAAQLQHPHILPLYDSGDADGLLYYVMPFVEGESLRQRLARERQLPLDDALRIVGEVADGLSYAHSLGVIHRDIKPENIMLLGDHALVVDFGVARAVSGLGEAPITETGLTVGTPAYMSPEQASGVTELDARSDIYSLGCVLYELLGGEPPHTGPTPQAILARKLTEEVRSLAPLRSTVTPQLDSTIRKALAPAPADRYATAYEFKQALLTPSMPIPTTAVHRPTMTLRAPVLRRTLAGLGVAAAAILAAVGVRALVGRADLDVGGVGVAVFPFRAATAQAEQWSEQLPDLLATTLDGTPGVRVSDPWSLWSSLRPERGAVAASPADVDEASRLARGAGAGRFVLASLSAEGRTFNLAVRIYRAGTAGPLHSFALTGSVDSVATLVQRLAVEVITHIWPRDSAPAVPELDRYATNSADALKAYLHAKEAMRRGRVDEAEAAIDTALAIDSTFSLALVEAIGIKSWAAYMRGELFSFVDLAERAAAYRDSLSERNRLRVEAMLASVRTDGPAAAEAATRIIALDSTDVDAWSKLAYYDMVYGWQYGRDERDAVDATDHALALDSGYVPNLVRRTQLAMALEPERSVARYVALLERTDTTNALARGVLLAHRAVTIPNEAFNAFADSLAALGPPEWRAVLGVLRRDRPDRAETVLQRLEELGGPGVPTDAIRYEQARLAIAEGRFREVEASRRGGDFPRGWEENRVRWLLVTPTLAGLGDRSIADSLLPILEAYVPPDSALAYFYERPVWWNGWVVGAYHAMYGDTTVARQWQRAFDTMPGGGTSSDYRGALQSDLEARLLARRGDLEQALAAAKTAYDQWSIHTDNTAESHPEPAMRFHYAMLLRASGQPDSAESILRSLVPPTSWFGFLSARASLELGQLSENRGDRAAASRHYAFALRLWERGGSEAEEWRAQAREGLQRVVAETSR